MNQKRRAAWQGYDWISLLIYLALVSIGWTMIYAASYTVDSSPDIWSMNTPVGKQTIWVLVSVGLLGLSQMIEPRFWKAFSFVTYIACMLALLLVIPLGMTVKGATSWFSLGPFSLQPSEFAKFGICLALASYLSYYKTRLAQSGRSQLIAAGMIFLPVLLILLQPDAGSAIIFMSLFLVLLRAGMNIIPFLIVGILGTLFILSLAFGYAHALVICTWFFGALILYNVSIPLLYKGAGILTWIFCSYLASANGYILETLIIGTILMASGIISIILKSKELNAVAYGPAILVCSGLIYATDYFFNHVLEPHQQDRINVWLNPERCDPRGALYNVLQSKTAISSGGLSGKGFLEGTMSKLNYVPEQTTDFIFTVVGEEQGFLGSMTVILLFTFLIYRILDRAESTTSLFSRYYSYSFACILLVHFIVNIGMTMGLMPIIGIPLPFISYGGSSIIAFSIMMGVYLRLYNLR